MGCTQVHLVREFNVPVRYIADKGYNIIHNDPGAAERARVAAAIERGATAHPLDPVTIPAPPSSPRFVAVSIDHQGSSSSSGHIPDKDLPELAREAEREANNPRGPGEVPYKARPAMKLEGQWKDYFSVVTPMSPPKAKPEPSSSPMTIRARWEYTLDENGDPIRLNHDEANSSCAAAEIRPVVSIVTRPVPSESQRPTRPSSRSSKAPTYDVGINNEFTNAMNTATAARAKDQIREALIANGIADKSNVESVLR